MNRFSSIPAPSSPYTTKQIPGTIAVAKWLVCCRSERLTLAGRLSSKQLIFCVVIPSTETANRLFEALLAEEFVLLPLDHVDLRAIQAILDKYRDQSVDFADAALVQLANRESISAVFTLDRRHFGLFRLQNGAPFRLILDET